MPHFFIILAFLATGLKAQGPQIPIYIQPYAGISVFNIEESRLSMQTGIRFTEVSAPFYIGIENHFFYSIKTEQWPGLGEYRYMRNYVNTGLAIGLNFLRRHKFNISAGFKLYGYNVNGKLKSDNERFKEFIKDYHHYHYNICPNVHLNYRIDKSLSVFVNFNVTSILEGNRWPNLGAGVAYNIYDWSK